MQIWLETLVINNYIFFLRIMLILQISHMTKDRSSRTDSWNQTVHEHSTYHEQNFGLMHVCLKGVSSIFIITSIKENFLVRKKCPWLILFIYANIHYV